MAAAGCVRHVDESCRAVCDEFKLGDSGLMGRHVELRLLSGLRCLVQHALSALCVNHMPCALLRCAHLPACPSARPPTLQAFAAVGTMEGAWYVHTGSARSFSEQQLVSCAWDQGPHGCDGGDYQPAFRCVGYAQHSASNGSDMQRLPCSMFVALSLSECSAAHSARAPPSLSPSPMCMWSYVPS